MGANNLKGTDYESFIYKLIDHVKNSGRIIKDLNYGQKNNIKGISGCKHQIDISFWDFSSNIPVFVLIECKNNTRPLQKNTVAAFSAIIEDIRKLNAKEKILGIVASAGHVQSGANQFAKYYDILIEETGIRPNFAFKYQNLIQAGISFKGSSNLKIKGTLAN